LSFIGRILRQPHAILSLSFVVVLAGVFSYRSMPFNLFPDTNRPVVSVVTQWPGAAASDVATDLTHPMEVRLSAIDGVRRVTSTSRDEVSAVQVEFEYGNPIDTAANKVSTELARVIGLLPAGIRTPLILKVTDAARPVIVLAATAAKGHALDLGQILRIVENPLRDALLRIPGVSEAEVFGGQERQVSVDLDRNLLEAHGLSVRDVAEALAGSNISMPAGLVHDGDQRHLLTAQALARDPHDLGNVLVALPSGNYVRVSDLGAVSWGYADRMALYRGNGKDAVAISILRGEEGHARDVIEAVQARLPEIRGEFSMLNLQIADTQGRIIDLTVENMLSALRDALFMTVAIILLFLGRTRPALITALSLPLSYLLTFGVMRFMGYEFNMVTLTAVIIAVGLLADDAVVVIENIERRMREYGERGLAVAIAGTREILLADAAGTISTVIVLVPIMFIGGYVQTVLRPLTVTLSVALFASLIVSITIIPLLVPWFMNPEKRDPLGWLLRPFERFFLAPTKRFYGRMLGWALSHRAMVLVAFGILFVLSARQLPVLGRELMPMMDTGVMKVRFEADPDTDDNRMRDLAEEVENAVRAEIPENWLLTTSTVVGSEPGVRSFGASRLIQQGEMTVNIVDRFQRNRSIYDIERGIRGRLRSIAGLISSNVTEFGATPLSSLRATVDVMISGPDPQVLDRLADQTLERMKTVRGLTGVERSWQGRSHRINLGVDPARARLYGLVAGAVASEAENGVSGMSAGRLRVPGENPIPVLARLRAEQRADTEDLLALPIRVPGEGLLPLAAMGTPGRGSAPSAETHQALLPTVDVLGYRRNVAVTHLNENVRAALADLELPRGYTISYEGEIKYMTESFSRLGRALAMGLALLYLMLAITFRSFLDPIAIMGSIPLALIGASWAMMIANKHGCMPSFMGFILLMGIVVNNGILLVDFTKVSLREGKSLREALLVAVNLRTRPILMTAGASAVGMVPVALEWAVGVERLSPLAVVAIGGLIAGTFLTLIAVPVLFHVLESLRLRLKPAGKSGG